MRAELVVFGRHFAMGSRARRRKLVVLIYLFLAALIVALWFAARLWPSWASQQLWFPLLFVSVFLNSSIFGGFNRWRGGLIKPFHGNEILKSYGIEPSMPAQSQPGVKYLQEIYQNDERDLRRRNEAHWRAYRYAAPAVSLPFGLAMIKRPVLEIGWLSGSSFDILLLCVTGAVVCVYGTLPQAILLWTEPDIEEPMK